VGYRGKIELQEKARKLRAEGRTLVDIAAELGVAKSSVSLWVRDVPFEPSGRRSAAHRRPHPHHTAKLAEIADCDRSGRERIGTLSDEAFLAAGTALYAGEGAKGALLFANTSPAMVAFFCAWLRRFFEIDERRLRVRVYLHAGLDLDAAEQFWSETTEIPRSQFRAPYRAKADPTMRRNKHEHGCAYVGYWSSRTHREVMGLVRALLTSGAIPG
jgi:hypothetical protein